MNYLNSIIDDLDLLKYENISPAIREVACLFK